MSPTVAAFNTLGGANDLGFVQQGFDLVNRSGTLDLGCETVEANRRLLGWDFEQQFGPEEDDWKIMRDVDAVTTNPPCSGFSTLTRRDLRGEGAAALVHTRASARYIGLCAPKLAALESVQQAWTSFPEHIHELHRIVNQTSGIDYQLTLLLHNNAALGGAAQRKRLWVVWSRIPFGVEPPIPVMVPTFDESVGDLQGLDDTWEKQPYRRPETWWSSRRRAADGVTDGHKVRDLTHHKRIADVIDAVNGEWYQGERLEDVARRCVRQLGHLPQSWGPIAEKLAAVNYAMGINQPLRWDSNRPCRVITGGALDQAIHPNELRTFTHREAARIQGFPDDWRLFPIRNVKRSPATYGKGVPVDAARWLAYWMKQALAGEPGTQRGEPLRTDPSVRIHTSTRNYELAASRDGRGHRKIK